MVRGLIMAVLLAAGVTAPASAAPMTAGAFTGASVKDVDVQRAARAVATQLASREWLGAPVTIGPIAQAERQVVAGVNYRLTFALTHAGAVQQGRAVVFQALKASMRLSSVELAPEHAPLVGPPTATGLPGGYVAQPAGDATVRQAAETIVRQLAQPEWLGRQVRLVSVQRAATQVVAGTNVYVALTVKDGKWHRPLEAVLYQDPRGSESLSWVALWGH